MKTVRVAVQILIALLVLAGAGAIAFIIFVSAPKTEPEDKKQAPKIVQTVLLKPTSERITVTAWGTVIPAREVTIRPQVSGRVIDQNESLIPGGFLMEGEKLLQIDRDDYELALINRKAELEQAKFDLEVESGRQVIAKREWEQLGSDIPGIDANPSLALRKPHLKLSEAMVERAESAISRAELDLLRTELEAPFNCMVVEENVEIGQLVENGNEVCRLVGTDEFWVRATLAASDLKRIRLPGEGREGAVADVHLDTGNGAVEPKSGTVIRLLADLEERGRMARLLVEVEDPLQLKTNGEPSPVAPLLLGSYVRVDIEAGRLSDVLTVPRPALHEGNRIWLVGKDKRIRIATPEILWTRPESVLIPNILREGEQLIVSELKAALPGMEVSPQLLNKEKAKAEAGSVE